MKIDLGKSFWRFVLQSVSCFKLVTQLTFSCSKSAIEALEKGMEYVQS